MSANFEFVPPFLKLGGNGPIMAVVQLALGLRVNHVGAIGKAALHTVFADFGKWVRVFLIGDPG